MKNRLTFQLFYLAFWVGFFLLTKALFLLYHIPKTALLPLLEIGKVFGYGLRLDFSFAAYICILPFFLLIADGLFPKFPGLRLIRWYTISVLVLLSLISVADLELYKAWGYRMDATPLQYLATPEEMLASAGAAPALLLSGIWLVLVAGSILLYNTYFRENRIGKKVQPIRAAIASFLYLILLVVPIRGGLQQIPVNQSDVYFSEHIFANHAAVNLPWNVMYSVLKMDHDTKNPYNYFSKEVAGKKVEALYDVPADSVPLILKTDRPNIIFIILESYTAKFVGSLGGEKGVTPQIDSLAKTGILFNNIYASGDRTQKGLVALLSGYPVQTTTSIVKTPRKTENLPHLAAILKASGYQTSYFYGGELAFANIKSYLLNAGYHKLIGKEDFDRSTYNSKWGAHDHIVFERALQELNKEKQPFFSTILTLSSHEPYEVPMPTKFKGDDVESLFRNSAYYTDQSLGSFMKAAARQPWWEKTLVVIVADHGHRSPGEDPNHAPSKFRIPLLFAGGALTLKDTIISTIGSQTDVIETVLSQVKTTTSRPLPWSRNMLLRYPDPFAFYVFNDGFGWVTPNGVVTFDNVSKQVISRDPGISDADIEKAKAYMQASFGDYLLK